MIMASRDEFKDDNDSEEEEFMSLSHGRHSMGDWARERWRFVESAALAAPAETKGQAIGARLSSGTRSIRSPALPHHRSVHVSKNEPAAKETTALLGQKGNNMPKADDENSKHAHLETPPLTKWIGIALLCAASYAFYNISIKKGSSAINPILGGVILQFVAALLGTILLACMIFWDNRRKDVIYDRKGLLWATGAGLWVGTAEMVSFVVSGLGVPATSSIPIIIGGSVLFGSVLGVFFLGETVLFHGWSGVALLTLGIALVATDPGEKVEEGVSSMIEMNDNHSPPLYIWIGPSLFCALSYALYNICIKKGSASINPIVGAVVLQFIAALFGTTILVVVCLIGDAPLVTAEGILWSCWAGLFVGAAELLSFCVSGMGVPASSSIPVLIGGSVGFGAILGIVMLGEALEYQGWIGVAVLMMGIALVATDPGEKVEGH